MLFDLIQLVTSSFLSFKVFLAFSISSGQNVLLAVLLLAVQFCVQAVISGHR